MKVFLVEDESMMRSGIKNNMPWEREGFEIVGDAANGMQAYPMIRQKQPDILITDIFMPCMDGLKLSRLVKTELPHIKILALSERKEFQHIQRAISIGITDFLPKPVDSGELMKAVKARCRFDKRRSGTKEAGKIPGEDRRKQEASEIQTSSGRPFGDYAGTRDSGAGKKTGH